MKTTCNQYQFGVERRIGGCFQKLGYFISRHPWKIIITTIFLNGLLGIGMVKMKKDIDVSRVYTPTNSQAVQDESKLLELFPDKSGSDFYSHQLIKDSKALRVIIKPKNGNVINIDFLDQLSVLDAYIKNVHVSKSEYLVNYSDICALRSKRCVVSGGLLLTEDFRSAVMNNNVSFPYFLLSSGESVGYSHQLSGVVHTNGKITHATHVKLKYYLRTDSNDYIRMADALQKALVESLKTYTNDEFDFAYCHSDSVSEELNANIAGDIKLFSLTFALMIAFACSCTFSCRQNCIGNRMFLGFAGVLAAGLSIIASFGLVSACGTSFVSIVGNMPFLIIGIGIDDMFILLSGLADAPFDNSLKSRTGQMLRTSGVAITITTLTDVLAFGAGATSSFKSVQNFCVYTGVAIAICYLNQLFLFSACVVVNEKRIRSMRHFISCQKTKLKEELLKSNKTKCAIFCCAGNRPISREEVEGLPEKLPRKFLTRLILLPPVKVIAVFVFAAYIGVSVWGALSLKQGLAMQDLVSEDSYVFKYSTWNEKHYRRFRPISFVIDQTYDYYTKQTQDNVKHILSNAKEDKFISTHSDVSWVRAYTDSAYCDNTSEALFVSGLKLFLKDARFRRFSNDVIISNDSITASRLYVFSNKILNSQDEALMMLDMHEIASKSPISVIAFSPAFIFYEQYVAVLPQTIQTLGIGIAAVVIITAIFMPHPLLILYVFLSMAVIMTGIVGFMSLWNLSLSSITMIHLIISVGFSVDFTAHICHAYMVATSKSRNQCVAEAIRTAGGPIFNGAVSSVIGILMLSIAKSYIFVSFFKVMLLVILLGVAQALFFLPVLLSVAGPRKGPNCIQGENTWRKDDKIGDEHAMRYRDQRSTMSNGRYSVLPYPIYSALYIDIHYPIYIIPTPHNRSQWAFGVKMTSYQR